MTSNLVYKLFVTLVCFLSICCTVRCGAIGLNPAATPISTAIKTVTPGQLAISTFMPATPTRILDMPLATSQGVVITLERTICFGTCPAYLLTIKGDGTVIFDGREYVKSKGQHVTTISHEQVKELVSEFERINYFSFSNFTDYDVTDMPSATTSITINGITKTVDHYYGDRDAPKELFELERKIDEIANSRQWIGE